MKRKLGLAVIMVFALVLVGCSIITNLDDRYMSIKGVAVDRAGNGIKGVMILGNSEFLTTTDDNGKWQHPNVKVGTKISAAKLGTDWEFNPVDVRVQQKDQEINFVLVKGEIPDPEEPGVPGDPRPGHYTIAGRVADSSGHGIPSVTITVEHDGDRLTAFTNLQGEYSRAGIVGTAKVTASKDGYTFSGPVTVHGRDDQVDFVGTETAPSVYGIGGRVADQAGQGIPSVTITVELADGSKLTAITRANGEYTQSGISGTVTVSAAKDGYSFSGPVTVSGPNENVDFVGRADEIVPVFYAVSGRALDSSNGGIPGVVITFEDEQGHTVTAVTDDGGFYTRDELTGTVIVTAYKRGWVFLPESLVVDGETEGLNFYGTQDIEPTYSVSGKILVSDAADPDDGKGVAAVLLTFEFLDHPSLEKVYAVTDNAGNWEKDGLIGRVKVTPTKADFTFYPESQFVDKGFQTVDFIAIPD
jgi:hypothetical protein